MKEIAPEVEEAIQSSNINSIHTIKIAPFPSMRASNRLDYILVIQDALQEAVEKDII